mgnify:CR=1 FL=1
MLYSNARETLAVKACLFLTTLFDRLVDQIYFDKEALCSNTLLSAPYKLVKLKGRRIGGHSRFQRVRLRNQQKFLARNLLLCRKSF